MDGEWGELLTLLVVIYALVLVGIYLCIVPFSGPSLPH